MKHFFQQNTFPVVILIAESCPNPLQNKLGSTIQRHRKTVSLHQGASDHTCECMPCTRIVGRQIRSSHFPVAISLTIVGIYGSLMKLIVHRNTGDNNHLRTFVGQETKIFFQFFICIVRLIRFIKQKEQLGHNGCNQIRLLYQVTHFLHHFHIKIGI